MLKKKYSRWIIEIVLILIVITAVKLWVQRDVVSGEAPNIRAQLLSGQSFDLYQSKQRPMLVHFWATWCPVCKFEQSNIENISKDHTLISVAMQSGNDKEIKEYMLKENLTFKVINDESGALSKKYNIRGVPVSFIVDKENKIKFVEVGYSTELGLRLRLWWAGL